MSDQPFLFEGDWRLFVPPNPYSDQFYVWVNVRTDKRSPDLRGGYGPGSWREWVEQGHLK